ncbi:MAG: GIY-YIG nuclease family protein [Patescibacteria group bacterium]
MYYVYCLRNKKDKSFYYGYTSDLKRRIKEHGSLWQLVYYEAYLAEPDARLRERKLKDYGQARSKLKGRISESLK